MLEYTREFMELATKLNYTAAAYQLNISQPTLSRHIADLENELGFKLFDRNPLSLTPSGRFYLESVSDIVERLDLIIEQSRAMSREDDRTLSICMVPSSCPYSDIVYESIARIRGVVPNVSPRFHFDRLQTVFDAVTSGAADIGILLAEPASLPDGFVCEWLVDSTFDAWLHESNPLLASPPVKFEDLEGCYLVCSTNQQYRTWYDGMAAAYRQRGMQPKVHLKDLDDLASFMLDLHLDEVLLGSDTLIASPYNPRLVRVRFDDPSLHYSAYLLYRSSARSVVKNFASTCHRVAEKKSTKTL